MRWLITVHVGFDPDALTDEINAAEGTIRDEQPIPLGDEEVAIFADGPVDLPRRLYDSSSQVLKVSPDSEPEAY